MESRLSSVRRLVRVGLGVIALCLVVSGLLPRHAAPSSAGPAAAGRSDGSSSTIEDASVFTATGPANPTVGNVAVLGSVVGNGGPASGSPISFVDTVPAGLTIDAAGSSSGPCSIQGQVVQCTINGLASGHTATVYVLVTPTAPGSYVNTVGVSDALGVIDPNLSNNQASATLNVKAAPSRPTLHCVVPRLRGTPKNVAKGVLRALDCRLGHRIKHAHSAKVPKGDTIRTKPGKGTYAAGERVTLVVSSGP